jgi:predicted nucleotidyltransferase component of viral defense system
MAEPVTVDFTGFEPAAVEKVQRLAELLTRLDTHPYLHSRLALHGGTALNLFLLGLQRLSVDVDLNYIGSTDRELMLAERPSVEAAITTVARGLGYNVAAGKAADSGRPFHLQYSGEFGADHVKVDVNYRNRSPLLPVNRRTVRLPAGGEVTFPLNSDVELYAGKTKALVGRVVIRDLYDVGQIATIYPTMLAEGDERLLRRIMLYYLSLSDPFPRPFEVVTRFAGRGRNVTDDLVPMLRHDDRPSLGDMIATAQAFLSEVTTPRNSDEAEYLNRAAQADFAPQLLFHNYPATLQAAHADPAAAWKIRNLVQALQSPGAGDPIS